MHDFIRGRLKPREEELEFLHFLVWSIRKMPKMSISAFHLETISTRVHARDVYYYTVRRIFIM